VSVLSRFEQFSSKGFEHFSDGGTAWRLIGESGTRRPVREQVSV
jgi:hypothetical protein